MFFTELETQLISFLSSGLTDSEIAEKTQYSTGYVKCLFHRIVRKYKLKNRCHLVAFFYTYSDHNGFTSP